MHQHTHSASGRPNSAVLDDMGDTGHRVDLESFEILEREQDWRRRGIREAIWVKQLRPKLNKSGGLRHTLSPLWDRPLGVKGPLDLKITGVQVETCSHDQIKCFFPVEE